MLSREQLLLHRSDIAEKWLRDLDYELDGLVIRTEPGVYAALGSTEHHPRGAIAYKFGDSTSTTCLRDVDWQVSRNGTLTPVANVDPIELSGVMVSKATLHHAAHIEGLELALGDEVTMSRRGGVIPHVEAVKKRGNPREEIRIPKKCPSCASKTVRTGDFVACSNPDKCLAARVGRVVYFCHVMEIDGIGPSGAETLLEEGVISYATDLCKPTSYQALVEVFGKRGEYVKDQVAGALAKNTSGETALAAVGIDSIGKVYARRLIEHFGSLRELLLTIDDALAKVPYSPEVVLKGFNSCGIKEKRAIKVINEIFKHRDELYVLAGFLQEHVRDEAPPVADNPFKGKAVVFTGRLTDMDREAARALVREYGGTTPDSVTMATDYLVVGDLAKDEQLTKRGKAARCAAKGSKIKVIDESAWAQMVAEATGC